MFVTEKIIVKAAVSRVCDRIFRVFSVLCVELLHHWFEAIHIRRILLDVVNGDELITGAELDIVSRQKLIVLHVIPCHPHECCIMVCFGVTVPILSADADMLRVFLQLFRVFRKLVIQPMLFGFVMSSSSDDNLRIESRQHYKLRHDLLQIFYGIFFPNAELYSVCDDQLIHFVQQRRHLAERLILVLDTALFPYPAIFVRGRRNLCPVNVYRSTPASANIYLLISMKITSTVPMSPLFMKLSAFIKLGAGLPSSNHLKRISILHSFSICRTEMYPFSIKANSVTRSSFSGSYSERSVLLHLSFTRYFSGQYDLEPY